MKGKRKGKGKKGQITPFAITDYRDIKKKFGIKDENRRSHIYIIGKTGTGKSTLLKNMALSDVKRGNGLVLLDPHGELAEDLLDFIPKRRIKDIIYFNPGDIEWPIAFNPLGRVDPEYHYLVVSGLISIFKKIWPEFWGPRLEHILRHSLLTLLSYPRETLTLLDLPKLLTDRESRKAILKGITDPQLKSFWFSEFERYSLWFRSEAISPILNKISQFLVTPPLRNIIAQKESAFKMREVIDEGKILIANLAKGRLGEENSSLLGAMLVTKIQLAALSRADLPEEKRKPFYLYVDEFHNFLTLSFIDILAEARKYGLSMILSHQYLGQLEDKIREAIFGNVGTLIAFRVGAEDAKILAQEFYPVFNQEDLTNLPNYHIYLKLMIEGLPSKPFSAITLPPPRKKRRSYKGRVVEFSRERYGRARDLVEKRILTRPLTES